MEETTKSDTCDQAQVEEQGQKAPSAEGDGPRPVAGAPTPRPVLKAMPVGSRIAAEERTTGVRAGSLYSPEDAAGGGAQSAPAGNDQSEPRKVVVPPLEQRDSRFDYATYRTAPDQTEASSEKKSVAPVPRGERRISTGFVLGTALIVIALISGIALVRLHKKVRALEQRISAIEDGRAPGFAQAHPAPQ